MHFHPGRNVYLTSWFIPSVLFFTGGETSVVNTRGRDAIKRTSTQVGTSIWPTGTFCLYCF